jgi:hypothetical protein
LLCPLFPLGRILAEERRCYDAEALQGLSAMTPDSQRFNDLPPLLVDDVASMIEGKRTTLVLLEHLPSGGASLFPVEYIHGKMEYRSHGLKDAVAHGRARLVDGGEFADARILFSQYHKTASLKGLTLEGGVKFA